MGMVADWIKDAAVEVWTVCRNAAHGIVGKVLATFGLTMVSVEAVLPNLKAFITSKISGLSGQAGQLIGYLGIGEVISMILSALAIRMAWKVFIVPTSVADQITGGTS